MFILILIVTLTSGILLVSLLSFLRVKNGNGIEALSVVIAVRDEPNLKNLIDQLLKQVGEKDEIIVVNDHSQNFPILPEQVQSIFLDQSLSGKKQAIYEGVLRAKNSLILTLDGDVSLPKNYLNYLRNKISSDKDCTVLPIKLKGNGFWNQLSNLELISLNALGLGLANLNIKLLANGANFCFKREHYLETYELHKEIPSGDDSFTLMHAKKVGALFESNNIPISDNDLSFIELLNQRLRWAGKTKRLPLSLGLVFGSLLTLVKLLVLPLIILNFFLWQSISLYYLLLLYWTIDYLFLFLVSLRYGEARNMALIPILITFYPLYLWLMLICMLFMRPTWKGRRL